MRQARLADKAARRVCGWLLLAAGCAAAGCSTVSAPREASTAGASTSQGEASGTAHVGKQGEAPRGNPALDPNRVTDALASPLDDLNLRKTEIPGVLSQARNAPYGRPDSPAAWSCELIATEVSALDEVLGPDLDAPRQKRDADLIDQGTEAAGNAAVDAVKGAAEGLVPFRSWLRKLSGAEKHSRQWAEAKAAGSLRRAFLKGVAWHQGCVGLPSPGSARPAQAQIDQVK